MDSKMNWFKLSFVTLCCYIYSSRTADVKPRVEKYLPDYNIYHNLSHIYTHLSKLAKENPRYIQLNDSTYFSKQRKSQPVMLLTDKQVTAPKINVLFSYGEHAREFFPIESMFDFIETVLHGTKSNGKRFSQLVLEKFNVYIVAMLNPDGRNYVERTKNYCWRGTSNGVDLNRNFDWFYGGKGSSSNKLDEEYRGEHVFSEIETKVLRELTDHHSFTAFVSFHSGIKQIYVPFSDTNSKVSRRLPVNYEAMVNLAKQMASSTHVKFTYGLAWKLNDYTADGTIFDYMAGKRHIPFSYAIELWGVGDYPGAQCFDLFNPKTKNLKADLTDVFQLYKTFFENLFKWNVHNEKQIKEIFKFDNEVDVPSLSHGYVLLAIVFLIFIIFTFHHKLPHAWRVFPVKKIVSLRSLSSSFSFSKLKS